VGFEVSKTFGQRPHTPRKKTQFLALPFTSGNQVLQFIPCHNYEMHKTVIHRALKRKKT